MCEVWNVYSLDRFQYNESRFLEMQDPRKLCFINRALEPQIGIEQVEIDKL